MTDRARSDCLIDNDQQAALEISQVPSGDQFVRPREEELSREIQSFVARSSFEGSTQERNQGPETIFGEPVKLRERWLFKTSYRADTFTSLQKWEGMVLEVKDDAFIARLKDLTQENPEEEAEFPFEELSAEDKKLVEPGAIFYWNIGYHDSISGQRRRESIIRFRRLPAWTEKELKAAKDEAKRIRDAIGWK